MPHPLVLLAFSVALVAPAPPPAQSKPAQSKPVASSPTRAGPDAPAPERRSTDPKTQSVSIPNTTVTIDLVQVPGLDANGAALWVARTETTWDQYDVFVYALDEPAGSPSTVGATGADAVARPSKPYVPPDRGFGHNGFPAMGMTFQGAQKYCEWLSAKTGRKFRLPTEAEWEHFALAGDAGALACEQEPECLAECAWIAENSDRSTKAVAAKRPNAFGLHDVHGNVAEWVVGPQRDESGKALKPLAKGGSFRDSAEQCAVQFDLRQSSAWNASDPQVPKSTWWLADCPFVGFRVVLDE